MRRTKGGVNIPQIVRIEDVESDFAEAYVESRLVAHVNRTVSQNLLKLGKGFRSLSDIEWNVINLLAEGKSLREVGYMISRSKGAVQKAYERAVTKLRKDLD